MRLNRLLVIAPLFLAACIFGKSEDDAQQQDNGITSKDPNAPDAKQTPAQTDVGCGGTDAPACAIGLKCAVGLDCVSLNCQDGICSEPGATAPPPTATDGIKNNTETDVDCGGPGDGVPRCGDNLACTDASDCTSLVCGDGVCQPPSPTDGVKNGGESDIDCGGPNAPACAVGQTCVKHEDCSSQGCGYDGKCALGKSCTQHMGGDTCGVGETGDPNAKHVSCCDTAKLPNSNTKIDRFLVTAGRMRAMVERLNGDVRGFVKTLPSSKWNPAWNNLVPSNKGEADVILGPYWAGAPNDADGSSKRSCAAGGFTGRTYWTPPMDGEHSDFSKDQLDEKALNCVGWHLMTAFCAWDGGRLGTRAELASAYTNGTGSGYPWSYHDTRPYVATVADSRLTHHFSYNYPDVPNQRFSGPNALDIAYHVAPPGRTPDGWNKQGVEIAGNLLTWVKDQELYFMWNFSWEEHSDNNLASQAWTVTAPEAPNGYYGIGGRCLRD